MHEVLIIKCKRKLGKVLCNVVRESEAHMGQWYESAFVKIHYFLNGVIFFFCCTLSFFYCDYTVKND